MLNWFKKKQVPHAPPIHVDVHSHLLAGIDDGVQSLEDAEEIILHFKSLGYTKLITTPHVMSDAYRNTTEGILKKRDELRQRLREKGIDIIIEAAAEYYLDDAVFKMLQENQPMLTFGDHRYLLFETNFLTEPFNLKEFIFLAQSKGYTPVLAHPERYLYLQNNWNALEDLFTRQVRFQVNISSITGYYSKGVQVTAQKLIDKGWVHMLGSDCHHFQHAQLVSSAQKSKYFQKALSLPLLNNTL
ncbi:tyrosine-protein phosphatase [Pseudochryseolinea flava]|uniref:protein-tyrosine-phosphatase n=1 Tax=Pseudochryseolinea flava TaxID=2059302 RepID=A0A364XTK0_9BACT|nr:CpsB/CapC family capsule biosynthesis tyrosine phosphatase [Pseudochryseolinea flava]RAV97681.1 capsular biosynthesis protein [Pseudochryseolinea flava]